MIDVIHPGVRVTGASVLALFQNLFGLAAGPFIAGVLSDAWGLEPALTRDAAFGAGRRRGVPACLADVRYRRAQGAGRSGVSCRLAPTPAAATIRRWPPPRSH